MTKLKPSSKKEYPFRYKLNRTRYHHYARDRLLELVRTQLRNVLDLVVLTEQGKEVKIDGFKLLSEKLTEHTIYDQSGIPQNDFSVSSLDSCTLYEPRIEFIKNQLESILSVVELENLEKIKQVDGFRLKNLEDWLVHSDCDPTEILEIAASRCNCDCIMCYNKGNPPSLALRSPRRTPKEELSEIKTRLKYFSPQKKLGLFPTSGCSYEVMAHPYFTEILRRLRKRTPRPIMINTNGRTLTPEGIDELANFQPLYLYLSLSSSSPERRKKLMGDDQPHIAISAPKWLRHKEIPYTIVIVPWPLDSIYEMCKDLYETVKYADDCEAHLIQINLPGYSRYFSSKVQFDLDLVWGACIDTVRELRDKTLSPIVVMPSMYEENLCEKRKNLPKIIGVVRNSPSARCGLQGGDTILEINGISVRTRPQARDMLSMLQKSESRTAQLTIQRGDKKCNVTMNVNDFSYPFSKEFDHHLGAIFMGTGLRMSYIEELREIIDSHRAKKILFLSSTLVKPTFEQCLKESHLLSSSDLTITIRVPRNTFFGGNVCMGDLLVVQDFIDCIKEYLSEVGDKPDLIVIPSSPFSLGCWGRDLTGRVHLDIEREVGIPVDLLNCDPIYE